MSKLFIADQAQCVCKFGTAPAMLKVSSQEKMFINANKKIATSMDLNNCFYPPGFVMCSFSYPPQPCKVMVTQWSNLYTRMRLNGNAYPLMPNSKATCAICGTECIEIMNEGQIEILGPSHTKNATAEHQGDLDPTGESAALGEQENISATGNII